MSELIAFTFMFSVAILILPSMFLAAGIGFDSEWSPIIIDVVISIIITIGVVMHAT